VSVQGYIQRFGDKLCLRLELEGKGYPLAEPVSYSGPVAVTRLFVNVRYKLLK
jgi:hypothetical protein